MYISLYLLTSTSLTGKIVFTDKLHLKAICTEIHRLYAKQMKFVNCSWAGAQINANLISI